MIGGFCVLSESEYLLIELAASALVKSVDNVFRSLLLSSHRQVITIYLHASRAVKTHPITNKILF